MSTTRTTKLLYKKKKIKYISAIFVLLRWMLGVLDNMYIDMLQIRIYIYDLQIKWKI